MDLYDRLVNMMYPLMRVYHRLEVIGEDNVPPEGEGCIITPNHTNWFGWDALVVGAALRHRHVRWVSWSYEKEMPLWDKMVSACDAILFNKDNPFPYDDIVENTLKPGGVVGIFPEGNNNVVGQWYRLRPFFPGCVRLSVMSGAPIVPTAVVGIEKASPIFRAKENDDEPITDLIAYPGVLPTKACVIFGNPVRPPLTEADLGDPEKLRAAAREIQLDVLDLLKPFRPNARAE